MISTHSITQRRFMMPANLSRLDSLAPADGSHRPTPEPTPPGMQPTTSGNLKAPDTKSDKLNALDSFRKGSEDFALTTNQEFASRTIRTLCAQETVGQLCWKTLSCGKKSPILITNASRSGSYMPEVRPLMVTFSPMPASARRRKRTF